jgi:protein-ribulosamine 3-kinase
MSPQPGQTELGRAIQQVIQKQLAAGSDKSEVKFAEARIASIRSVSGGCISQAESVTLANGRTFFVKSNHRTPELFSAESAGLAEIESTQAIRVPHVIGTGLTESGVGFVVLESIETGKPGVDFETRFGRSLANMHARGRSEQFGFHLDNHIGSSNQINRWTTRWVEFWAQYRLGYQLSLAQENGMATAEFSKRCDRLISKLKTLIEIDVEPSLIHGDLWSGNFMVANNGEPVLIDPAVYFGSRESEFGMTTLFGGFGSRFYEAYNECWPLADGWHERVEIYRLYHLMNHLNLFGKGYFGACMEILKKYS